MVRNQPKPAATRSGPNRSSGRLCQAYRPTAIGTATISARAIAAASGFAGRSLLAAIAAAMAVSATPANPTAVRLKVSRSR